MSNLEINTIYLYILPKSWSSARLQTKPRKYVLSVKLFQVKIFPVFFVRKKRKTFRVHSLGWYLPVILIDSSYQFLSHHLPSCSKPPEIFWQKMEKAEHCVRSKSVLNYAIQKQTVHSSAHRSKHLSHRRPLWHWEMKTL